MSRRAFNAPPPVQTPVPGSKISVLESEFALSKPPVSRAFPFANKVDVWSNRAVLKGALVVHVSVAGSYVSVLESTVKLKPLIKAPPPATSTLPSGNKVAECRQRAPFIAPVPVQTPVAGS